MSENINNNLSFLDHKFKILEGIVMQIVKFNVSNFPILTFIILNKVNKKNQNNYF